MKCHPSWWLARATTHHRKRFAYWPGLGNLQILVLENQNVQQAVPRTTLRGVSVTAFCISAETTDIFQMLLRWFELLGKITHYYYYYTESPLRSKLRLYYCHHCH